MPEKNVRHHHAHWNLSASGSQLQSPLFYLGEETVWKIIVHEIKIQIRNLRPNCLWPSHLGKVLRKSGQHAVFCPERTLWAPLHRQSWLVSAVLAANHSTVAEGKVLQASEPKSRNFKTPAHAKRELLSHTQRNDHHSARHGDPAWETEAGEQLQLQGYSRLCSKYQAIQPGQI